MIEQVPCTVHTEFSMNAMSFQHHIYGISMTAVERRHLALHLAESTRQMASMKSPRLPPSPGAGNAVLRLVSMRLGLILGLGSNKMNVHDLQCTGEGSGLIYIHMATEVEGDSPLPTQLKCTPFNAGNMKETRCRNAQR